MEYSTSSTAPPHHRELPYQEASVGPASDPQPYAPSFYSNPNGTSDPSAGYYYEGHAYSAAPDANESNCQGYDYGSLNESATAGMVKKPSTITTIDDLNKKMQRVIDGGAPAETIKVCTSCNVVCNSAKAFAIHCVGAKHVAQVKGISSNDGLINFVPGTVNPLKNKVQPIRCELCKLECNSQEAYNSHIMGKKHRNKAEKLKAPYIPKPGNVPTDSAVAVKECSNSEGLQKAKKPEDLEVKKRKVIEGGAASSALRVCMLCNVVCNSETVFQIHVSGQKHKSAVKNQEGGATC